MVVLEVELTDGPHGLDHARSLRAVTGRTDPSRRNGVVLWNVTLTLTVRAPDSWWNQARQYFPNVMWLRSRSDVPDDQRALLQDDFENPVPVRLLEYLNSLASSDTRSVLKAQLPESFLRSGVIHTNMETVLTVLRERGHYNSGHWHLFCHGLRGMESLQPLLAE
ncbi:MAG: hypothetical protein WD492_16545 [Alkalispirochaeta sp.]